MDLTGVLVDEDVPNCPICGSPIYITDAVLFAQTMGKMFLAHAYCGDIEFYNA